MMACPFTNSFNWDELLGDALDCRVGLAGVVDGRKRKEWSLGVGVTEECHLSKE